MTPLQQHQGVSAELIGEFLFHLEDLSRPSIVSESPGHFLVRHGPLVAFSLPPHLCHLVLVPGRKTENTDGCWHPGHTVGHVWILQHLKEKVKETHLSPCIHQNNSEWRVQRRINMGLNEGLGDDTTAISCGYREQFP